MIRAASDWTKQTPGPFWANAILYAPRDRAGLVILAHHEIAARRKAARYGIAEYLASHRFACCTVGLASEDDYVGGRMVLDIETLADRLHAVVDFMAHFDDTYELPVAVFGEGYCGAAAMVLAANHGQRLQAVGAYCGRPDLGRVYLPRVRTATLLVVPGRDRELLAQNERAFGLLKCPSQIAVIGNATSMLSETGAMHACRYLIRRWCESHVARRAERLCAG